MKEDGFDPNSDEDYPDVLNLLEELELREGLEELVGLCCYTEYWGKLVKGISEGCGKTTFNAFLDRLDPTYYPKLRDRANIYRDIRCGLAHSYLIAKNANIDAVTDTAEHGIVFDAKNNWYSFYVLRHILRNSNVLSINIRAV